MNKNPHAFAKLIFNIIAPFYAVLNNYVRLGLKKSMQIIQQNIELTNQDVLDIGTGTGVWAMLFKENGAKNVSGIDIAPNMIRQAKRKFGHQIEFSVVDGINFSHFPDNSYDIVTASLVLHGMKQKEREIILLQMQRISKKYVVINDFYGKTPAFVRFLEFMERSDYKHFKINFCTEFKNYFPQINRKQASFGIAVYWAEKK
jgi:ubiquinone/menaquinone biosynthesis C-methylase UbiE